MCSSYFRELRARRSEAKPVEFRQVRFNDGTEPEFWKCHDNVARWVNEDPDYLVALGWLLASGGLLLDRHSVVRGPDGTLFDLTPMHGPRPPFLEHRGTSEEYDAVAPGLPQVNLALCDCGLA
jgi:hypothetical protein